MGKKVKVKTKTKIGQGGRKPVKPRGGDSGLLSEKIIIVVKKRREEAKNEKD